MFTFLNYVPVVGQAKALYHYASGNKEAGDEANSQSTKSTAVIGGAVAHTVAGGLTGMAVALADSATLMGSIRSWGSVEGARQGEGVEAIGGEIVPTDSAVSLVKAFDKTGVFGGSDGIVGALPSKAAQSGVGVHDAAQITARSLRSYLETSKKSTALANAADDSSKRANGPVASSKVGQPLMTKSETNKSYEWTSILSRTTFFAASTADETKMMHDSHGFEALSRRLDVTKSAGYFSKDAVLAHPKFQLDRGIVGTQGLSKTERSG